MLFCRNIRSKEILSPHCHQNYLNLRIKTYTVGVDATVYIYECLVSDLDVCSK